jgi:hypothetical protein
LRWESHDEHVPKGESSGVIEISPALLPAIS